MRITEHRYARDLRRIDLAQQLLSLGVRTNLICAWTGLTPDRVRKLHHAYDTQQDRRPTGPTYTVVTQYSRDETLRREAAAFGAICRVLQVLPDRPLPQAAEDLPGLTRGEWLLVAFHYHRELTASSQLSFERTLHLVMKLAEAREVALDTCATCGAIMLFDYLGSRDAECRICRSPPQEAAADVISGDMPEEPSTASDRQTDLFEGMD